MSVVDDLVFDVGLHRGEDSAFYLAKGYRVVAFEAHPEHIAHAEVRFAAEIAARRLVLVEGAIAGGGADAVTFFVHPDASEWGTIDGDWVARNEMLLGASVPVTVPTVDFAAALAEHGVPHYMKVDIEGADRLCFEAIAATRDRPRYVSLESCKTDFGALRGEFELLESLGYDAFAVVQQATIGGRTLRTRKRDGSPLVFTTEPAASGDFGRDLRGWTTRERALRRFRAIYAAYWLVGDTGFARRTRLGNRILSKGSSYVPFAVPGWHDVHARHARAG